MVSVLGEEDVDVEVRISTDCTSLVIGCFLKDVCYDHIEQLGEDYRFD